MDINEAASLMGKKGGKKTKMTKPGNYYSKLGVLSGQSRREKREKLLSMFTVGELENKFTLESITKKLEQLDK